MSLILIIEDDQNLREGLELLFQIEGYDTTGASNGQTGIELALRDGPDVVITDFQMPVADGLDVVRALRSDGSSSDMPIIFLTADHRPNVRRQAAEEGVNAFLTKPFETTELLDTVASCVSQTQS